jgi:phosphopantothenoylcysteine decarboxylase/phosphopantothenate--cysteine ligase
MLQAVDKALPCDIAICAAAVGDWHVSNASQTKLKKDKAHTGPTLSFAENPDILKHIAQHKEQRPSFVAGFAAETDDVESNATAKFIRKGCDALFANYINERNTVFGADENTILYIARSTDNHTAPHCEQWPKQSKAAVADMIVRKVIQHLVKDESITHTDATPMLTKLEAI